MFKTYSIKLWFCYYYYNTSTVTGSIALTASNYDAYESDGQVSVCAVINAAALERDVVVQLSSQDSTARSEFINFIKTIKGCLFLSSQ